MPEGRLHLAPDPSPAAFGPRVRDLRLRAGLSQKQLADFSTLSVRAIRNIETGRVKNPRQDTLRLLLKTLNLGPGEWDLLERLAPHTPAGAGPAPPAGQDPCPLPVANGPLIGRRHEFEALMNLFVAEHSRLITVTGIEGVGKTRLALEFARALHRQGATVLWVPMAEDSSLWSAHSEAALLSARVRALLHTGERGARQIRELIGDRDLLIAFDGQRQSGASAEAITQLLALCQRVRILTTSRCAVGRAAETLFPLAPLAVPDTCCESDPTTVERAASVRMFLTRMQRVRPDFRLDPDNARVVGGICRALDGLPAALERGARWSLVYSPRQLAQQLAADPLMAFRAPDGAGWEAPPIFESVRRRMAVLTPRQRRLLLAMARHAGHWSIAEAARASGISVTECAKDIYALLIHSLIRRRDDGDLSHFEALNLVRHVQRDHGEASA